MIDTFEAGNPDGNWICTCNGELVGNLDRIKLTVKVFRKFSRYEILLLNNRAETKYNRIGTIQNDQILPPAQSN
jgi:hypothetical protein